MTILKIIVCIKPVPDPSHWNRLKLDPETMLLERTGIPPVINALDRNALEQAILLKEKYGATISVLSMAPGSATEQLQEALALGCDQAYLLTDAAFAGADTLATARCLTAAVRKIGKFDLIFCGAYSLDGSTAQLGPQIAELLEIPDLTHTVALELNKKTVRVSCKRDQGFISFEADVPVLVTFDKEINRPRIPGMVGIKRAMTIPVVKWSMTDLDLKQADIGLPGSPTRMLSISAPDRTKKGEILKGPAHEVVRELLTKLRQKKILVGEGERS